MPDRRALVDCVVLSLQDARVLYPCCKGCFSRIDFGQQDTTRCRCSRCGYSCPREEVDYRYRLSMMVVRDTCIFGVTVFGTCLNPFFGIHASGLQRLVGNSDEAATRYTLLMKAVQDCFIGRRFIFGIKVTETESWPWLGGPVAGGSSSKEAVHFIASQMILPKATALGGCTVVSYYRALLQKAAQCELGSTDPSKTSRPPATTLLLIPHRSPASSFNNATLSASGLLSQSPQSSQYQDCTLTPTPPWQQSLGLVTSSAEQEEDYSTQYSGDEDIRQTVNNKIPHHAQRGCRENHKVTEERALPLLSLKCSTSSSPSLAKYPCSSIETAVANTPNPKTWISSPPPCHNSSKVKWFSPRQLTKTFLSSSVAWEDLPFSESLTEFLCEENKDVDIVSETEPHLNPVACADESQAGNIYSHECDQEDEKVGSLSFENEEEEQLEGDTYNCSADLFSSPLIIQTSTKKLNTHAETVRMTTGTCPLLSKQHLRREKDTHSTPDKQKRKSRKCTNRDRLIPTGTKNLDFIPPSQSTPIVKVKGPTASSYRTLTLAEFSSQPDTQDSSVFHGNLPEFEYKERGSTTFSLCKLNCVSANQLSQCGGESTKENLERRKTSNNHSPRFTPERGFWKPDKLGNHVLSQQHPRVQTGALNRGSALRINHRSDSNDCDVTANDYEDNELIVPPTPAAETRLKLRRRKMTGNGSSNLGNSWEGQKGDGVNCKRTLLDQTLTTSQKGLAQTVTCDSETVDGSLDGCYRDNDENEACDWSKDLFSDSI